ncbi:MAG: DNA translocase FtsK 4TM domain-containing protein, partial [Thermodesulfobacteriota bacterium]
MSTPYQRRRERRSDNSSKSKKLEALPIANKKQILGFFLMLFSVLVIFSIVSYSDIDQSKLESFNVKELLTKESQAAAMDTSNWLGMTGVYISSFLIRNTFGYFSAIVPVIFIAAGFYMMRKKKLMDMMQFTVYSLVLMILFSSMAGMLKTSLGDRIPYNLSGRSGAYFSSVVNAMLGTVGGYLLVAGLMLVFGFLIADRDIVKSLARLKMFFVSLREKYKSEIEEIENKKAPPVLPEGEEKKAPSVSPEGGEEALEEYEIKDTNINRPAEEPIVKVEKA